MRHGRGTLTSRQWCQFTTFRYALSLAVLNVLLEIELRLNDEQKPAVASPEVSAGHPVCKSYMRLNHPDVVQTYNAMAVVMQRQGGKDKREAAMELYKKVLVVKRATLGDQHPEVGSTYNAMAGLLEGQELHEDALALYERALALSKRPLGTTDSHPTVDTNSHPTVDAGSHPSVDALRSAAYGGVSRTLQALGRLPDAAVLLREALQICTTLHGAAHPSTLDTAEMLADVENNIAVLLENRGRSTADGSLL
jgi:tetratricopeptide (TPR) repeat protein